MLHSPRAQPQQCWHWRQLSQSSEQALAWLSPMAAGIDFTESGSRCHIYAATITGLANSRCGHLDCRFGDEPFPSRTLCQQVSRSSVGIKSSAEVSAGPCLRPQVLTAGAAGAQATIAGTQATGASCQAVTAQGTQAVRQEQVRWMQQQQVRLQQQHAGAAATQARCTSCQARTGAQQAAKAWLALSCLASLAGACNAEACKSAEQGQLSTKANGHLMERGSELRLQPAAAHWFQTGQIHVRIRWIPVRTDPLPDRQKWLGLQLGNPIRSDESDQLLAAF